MPSISQQSRSVAIGTPLGDDVLLLKSMNGTEQLGRLFQFNLQLVSEKADLEFEELMGRNVTVRLNLPGADQPRYFNGMINRFSLQAVEGELSIYSATMVPWLWFLTRVAECRIFQNMTVPDILKEVFSNYGFSDIKDSLSASYREWEYCVQYRETSFNFVSRLMEQEGIYYYFEHENGKHTLVLADGPSAHLPCPECDEVLFRPPGSVGADECLADWTVEKQVTSGLFAHRDFNFEKPKADLGAASGIPRSHAMAEFEVYDYPGEYTEAKDGDQYASIRMQELQVGHEVARAAGNVRGLLAGGTFSLVEHPRADQNREYLITQIQHQIVSDDFGSGGGSGSPLYQCALRAIPHSEAFRSQRSTPKPQIAGPQTAIVTGPNGEEIHTDEHGRVKVQFHWDRDGQYNENSSCWLRVSQNWAGKKWGAFFLPRIGQEVIVEFLEGDPDRPIITGSVYNGESKPPYKLPDDKTKSTLKSNSSKGGEGFNEIRFEDKKDDEQIFIHAEKDMDTCILNDHREGVKGNYHLHVGKGKKGEGDVGSAFILLEKSEHRTVNDSVFTLVKADNNLVVEGDQFASVKGADHQSVTGDRNTKVDGTISREAGKDIQEKAGMNHALQAGMNLHIKAGINVVIEAGVSLTIKAGASFVNLGPAGVAISGPMIQLNSGGAAGSGSGASPVAPESPEEPEAPDEAEEGEAGETGAAFSGSDFDRKTVSITPVKVKDYSPAALVMHQAAHDGTPFCEECERARQQQGQS